MTTILLQLNSKIYEKLVEIAAYLKIDQNEVMNKALLEYLEDQEDIKDADEAYVEYLASGKKGYTIEELRKEYGLQP